MSLWIQETYVAGDIHEETDGKTYLLGEPEIYETGADTTGELYRQLARSGEYGRCTSKVYVDRDGKTEAVGWVFESRQKYEDSPETYLRQVWVSVVDGPAVVTPINRSANRATRATP